MRACPLLLGHRGSRDVAVVAENTFSAFDLAIEHGCDGIEFDVRLSADGIPVVHHDEKIGHRVIAQLPQALLPEMPSLSDILAGYGKRAFLDIELKVDGAEAALLSALRDVPPERGYVVSSFQPAILTELRVRTPTVPLGWICQELELLSHWVELPVEYVISEQALVDADLVRAVHHSGKMIFVWTVNDPGAMLDFAELGVDGIISDYAKLLVDTLRHSST